MPTIEIDTDRGFEDYELQIAEMETDSLIELAEILADNPTPTQTLFNELDHRKSTGQKLQGETQREEIKDIIG